MIEESEQQQVDRGNAAEELMNMQAFKDTFAMLQNGAIQHWMTSKPEEEAQRTAAYYLVRGLIDFAGLLNQQVQIRDQILDKQNDGVDHE